MASRSQLGACIIAKETGFVEEGFSSTNPAKEKDAENDIVGGYSHYVHPSGWRITIGARVVCFHKRGNEDSIEEIECGATDALRTRLETINNG